MSFFKDEEKKEDISNVTETKIKVGETEYSQEELDKYIGFGKQAEELESRWNTKLDSLMPSYTKTTQELKAEREEKERLVAELEATRARIPVKEDDPETLRKQAIEEAKNLGLVTRDDFDKYYQERRAGEKLLEETTAFVEKTNSEGKPKTDVESLLQYMVDNGIKKPSVAYKDMFEVEYDEWKEKQIAQLKPSSFKTTSPSTAGGKAPEEVKATNENLRSLLKEHFSSLNN
jgi:hypothetical protein